MTDGFRKLRPAGPPEPSHPGDAELAAFAEGGGSALERARLREHLDTCEECFQVAALLSAGAEDQPPAALQGDEAGRYVLQRRLGAGAMAVVYEGFDRRLERKVAIKLLRRGGGSRHALRLALQREASALAQLRHPNVVGVVDVGELDDQLFIAMELVEGGTLADWLEESPRTWRQILDVFVAFGRGLAEAHAIGLVHRDVKPRNVLISRDGRACISDFGLVGRPELEGAARAGDEAIVGTPGYMSPEQLRGLSADARADLFSFCVALYQALFHQRPFPGQTLGELAAAIEAGPPRAPPACDVPPWVTQAILRGLRADPGERFPSMAALLAELAPKVGERYELVALLGRGRSGRVYLAADTRLQRSLAVKLVDVAADPAVLQLARLQATLEPPTLCRVFDVRDAEGEPAFIAQELVEGLSLAEALVTASLEQRVRALALLAQAAEAAHRAGAALGPAARFRATPAGEPRVTSLRPGTAEGDLLELTRLLRDAVARSPDVPALASTELQFIATRWEGAAGTPSAAAGLARDLQRFAAGEPIPGRRGLPYLLRKHVQRSPRLALVGAAAAVVVLGSLGFAAFAAVRAERRAAISDRWAGEARELESLLRYAALLPLHDTSAEREQVRARMRQLEEETRNADAFTRAAVAGALGRAELSLGNPAEARRLVQQALAGGDRTSAHEITLGRALGELYQRERQAAEQIPDPVLREERLAAAARDLREPAVAHLRAGGAGLPHAALAQALLAFYEHRLEASARLANAALAGAPWLYEAHTLLADIDVRRAATATNSAAARESLARGALHLETARAMARSDPQTLLARCDLLRQRLELTGGAGAETPALLRDAGLACEDASTAAPWRAAPLAGLAALHRLSASWSSEHGFFPEDELTKATGAARKALAREPGDPVGWLELGRAFEARASLDSAAGRSAIPALEEAVSAHRLAIRTGADVQRLDGLAVALTRLGLARQEQELDPEPAYREAGQILERALQLAPQLPSLRTHQSRLWSCESAWAIRSGGDGRPWLARALAEARAVATQWPDPMHAKDLGDLELAAAEDATDPANERAHVAEALRAYETALQLDPEYLPVHESLSYARMHDAVMAADEGRDPGPLLADARRSLDLALRQKPSPVEDQFFAASLDLLEARFRLEAGASPATALAQVGKRIAALRRTRVGPYLYALAADGARLEARWALRDGRDPWPALRRSLGALRAPHPRTGEDPTLRLLVGYEQGRALLREGRSAEAAVGQLLATPPAKPAEQEPRTAALRGALWLLAAESAPTAERSQPCAEAQALLSAALAHSPGALGPLQRETAERNRRVCGR